MEAAVAQRMPVGSEREGQEQRCSRVREVGSQEDVEPGPFDAIVNRQHRLTGLGDLYGVLTTVQLRSCFVPVVDNIS